MTFIESWVKSAAAISGNLSFDNVIKNFMCSRYVNLEITNEFYIDNVYGILQMSQEFSVQMRRAEGWCISMGSVTKGGTINIEGCINKSWICLCMGCVIVDVHKFGEV